jgi:hypothetical protein
MEEEFSFHGVNPPFLPPGFLCLGASSMDRHVDSASLNLCTLAPPLRAAPQLPDGVIEDILLRVPPEDPARLLRSALACKHWARLIADREFRRRYGKRNGQTPMLLGFLANLIDNAGIARFIPTGTFRPARVDRHGYRAHDSRHGRVLLNRIGNVPEGHDVAALVVWDPTTDKQWPLPLLQRHEQVMHWNAAVLCAASATCDHLDCHLGSFLVVFVGIDTKEMFTYIYSSKCDVWSEGTSAKVPNTPLHEGLPAALARNALYFMFHDGKRVLKYDLATGTMSVISLPHRRNGRSIMLMTMEDGGLGFADVVFGGTLRLWAMETDPTKGWSQRTVIHLRRHLAPRALVRTPDVVAIADIAGVIFLNTTDGLYIFYLKSRKGKKIMNNRFYDIVPYMSFYTPGTTTFAY